MPYEIKKEGSFYKVINKKTGKVHAKCSTKEKAEAQVFLLRGVEHGWKPTGKKANESKESNERAGLEDFDETSLEMPKKKKKKIKESNLNKILSILKDIE